MKVRPWVCRLYPEKGSRLYARVLVWPTKASMLQALNHTKGRQYTYDTQGVCTRVEIWNVRHRHSRKDGCFAEVTLWRGCLGMNVITHEFFHATMAWAERVRLAFSNWAETRVTEEEEALAYAHGHMCAQFVTKATQAGLYG